MRYGARRSTGESATKRVAHIAGNGWAGAKRFGPAPFILAVAALIPAPRAGASTVVGIPTLCAFRNLTGLPCPGCGMTRSVVCCAHCAFRDAFTFHPLGPLVFAGLIAVALWRLPVFQKIKISPRLAALSGYAGIAALFGVWALRLAGWLPLPPL